MIQPLRKEQRTFDDRFNYQSTTPKRRSRRRVSFNPSKCKLPVLVIVFLLCYLAISFGSQFSRLSNMQRDVGNIQLQVQELRDKNATLQDELRMVQSDAYIEKTAREKMGLVKPGETRVVAVPEGTKLNTIQAPAPIRDGNVAD